MGRRGRKRGEPIHGWLALDKPVGISSFQAVEKARRLFNAAKAGHGGTLDPFADGLLPIAFGEATKVVNHVLEGDKGYRFEMRFGSETDSGDLTGTVISESDNYPSRQALEAVLPDFQGWIDQVPPAHSAIKVNGQRAYKLAHKGEAPDMPTRRVQIKALTLEQYVDNVATLSLRCSKGLYVRAVARDMGRSLECGAHLIRLTRTETLGFFKENAVGFQKLECYAAEGRLHEALHPVDRVLDDIPALRLHGEDWYRIRHGQTIRIADDPEIDAGVVRIIGPEGTLGALAELGPRQEGRSWRSCRSKRGFNL
ncbi:MAG: tRNA pseudouridine(55) synthase TruB [Magnetococcales bacterium]|nr:tRNA pseudouridine(55) synthase TruB [Magnetococcales bacterium]